MTLSEVGIVVLMLKQSIEENAALKDKIRPLEEAFASINEVFEAEEKIQALSDEMIFHLKERLAELRVSSISRRFSSCVD